MKFIRKRQKLWEKIGLLCFLLLCGGGRAYYVLHLLRWPQEASPPAFTGKAAVGVIRPAYRRWTGPIPPEDRAKFPWACENEPLGQDFAPRR